MTTSERYILAGNLSMKEGKLEQAIINYRCAILSGDQGQKGFALCRAVKCYCLLSQFEKAIDLSEKTLLKFGEAINSKSLMDICAEAAEKIGKAEEALAYSSKGAKIEKERIVRSSATSGARKSPAKTLAKN